MDKKIKNIIFDWSGVISNDFDTMYETVCALLKEYNATSTPSKQKLRREFRTPLDIFYKKYLESFSMEDLNNRYFELITFAKKPKPYPKARKTIRSLYLHGYNMAILSTHDTNEILNEMREYNINPHYFKEIIGNTQDKVKIIKNVVERNNFDIDETCYVGDQEHDIDTAKAAGVISVASTYGYKNREQLAPLKPDFFVETLDELWGIV